MTPSRGLPPHEILDKIQSQWYFTRAELRQSPSIAEGMPVAQELANRQKGVNFITQVGIMLKLPQVTLATASVYLQRFFMRHPMAFAHKPGLHHYEVAATALFLATKVEENWRKTRGTRELVVACCRVAQKQPNLAVDEQSKEYWRWRDTILHNEDLLLEALCFDLQLESPYRILFDFLCYYEIQDKKLLRNTSWAFLNDSHVTIMCLMFHPRTIAGSALYLGARLSDVNLPDDESGRPWWEHLDLDVREIQAACNLMAETYENPTLPRQGQKDAYSRDDDLATFDRTRSATTPRTDRSPAQSQFGGSAGVKRDRDELDGPPSEEWGAARSDSRTRPHEPENPSPKRQRRESDDQPMERILSSSRVPLASGSLSVPVVANGRSSQAPLRHEVDDVQQRIDDIINSATNAGPIQQSSTSNLPQRAPNQYARSTQPISRQSSHGSQPPRGQSSNGNGPRESTYHRPPPDRGPSEDQNGHEKLPPAPPPPPPPPTSTVRYNGTTDIDDAEKVDYGSEEGEL